MSDVIYLLDLIPQPVMARYPPQTAFSDKESFSIGKRAYAAFERALLALVDLFVTPSKENPEPLRVQIYDLDAEDRELDEQEEEFRIKWWEYPVALILYLNNLRH